MARRWKWFLRPRKVVIDLIGQVVPDGNGSGRFRRRTVEDVVPGGLVTSRCDGATVYEQPGERREALAANQRVDRYARRPSGERSASSIHGCTGGSQ